MKEKGGKIAAFWRILTSVARGLAASLAGVHDSATLVNSAKTGVGAACVAAAEVGRL